MGFLFWAGHGEFIKLVQRKGGDATKVCWVHGFGAIAHQKPHALQLKRKSDKVKPYCLRQMKEGVLKLLLDMFLKP